MNLSSLAKQVISDVSDRLGLSNSPVEGNKASLLEQFGMSWSGFNTPTFNSLSANDRVMHLVSQKFNHAQESNGSEKYETRAIIFPIKEGRQKASYEELNRRSVQAALEMNGIKPSKIEMEEMMARVGDLDLNNIRLKSGKWHEVPGLMVEARTHKAANGQTADGYKLVFYPEFQKSIVDDYKQITGELAATPDKKAVVEMNLNERMYEAIKIAHNKGYISKEVSNELSKLTPNELILAFGIGGAVGLAAKTGARSVLGPLGAGLAMKELLQNAAEFDTFGRACAKATSRAELDKPAQEFAKWMGKL